MWTQQQKLTPADGTDSDAFGWSVVIEDNTIAVGSKNNQSLGAVYVFTKSETAWSQQQKLTSPNAQSWDEFGHALGLFDNTLAVAAPYDRSTATHGAVYLYQLCDSPGSPPTRLTSPEPGAVPKFGLAVAVSGATVMVGLDQNYAAVQGKVFAFPRTGTTGPLGMAQCESSIIVNQTSDEEDADINNDKCDVDVNQAGDQCTLRAAIQTANHVAGADTINFNIPGGGTRTISPISQLPVFSEKVTLDATTQPGYDGTPLIELAGSTSFGGIGFLAGSADSELRGMAINGFATGVGIATSGVKIEKCYFGLSPNGMPAGAPTAQMIGIDIRGGAATNNTIGGLDDLRNVISNNQFGITISEGASANHVIGNRIGTNIGGTSAVANEFGIVIDAASNNRIGDDTGDVGNLISGNTSGGIVIQNGAANNIIADNYIGTDVSGNSAIGNLLGIGLNASTNNRIGVESGTNGNLISGNNGAGVILQGNSNTNIVASNLIGTNSDGTGAVPNGGGVIIIDSDSNRIGTDGGASATNGNTISGNTSVGVTIQTNSSANLIAGNKIGTEANGAEALGNGQHGMFIDTGSSGNAIKYNIIGGHTGTESGGIIFGAASGADNSCSFNAIGVASLTGTTDIANRTGIVIYADGEKIGVDGANVIGHNLNAGIWIRAVEGSNPTVENNVVMNNLVGTNGTDDIGNTQYGIWLNGATANNTVAENIVSGNDGFGIALTDGADNNTIRGNFVGVNRTGTSALANGGGIWVRQSSNNKLDTNLVSGNPLGILIGTDIGFGPTPTAPAGVAIGTNSYTTANELFGNVVGLNAARNAAIPGCSIGIAVGENARSNQIGTATGPYNFVSGNDTDIGYGIFLGTLTASPAEDLLPRSNTFQKNLVGLGGDLHSTIANKIGFVLLKAVQNTIGGTSNETANIIVANTPEGISLREGANENTFLRNFLGVLPPGFGMGPERLTVQAPNGTGYGNTGDGVLIEDGASNNTLGGSTPDTGLVIANNGGNGIKLASTAGNGNRFGSNSIYDNALSGISMGEGGFVENDPADPDVGPNKLQNYPTFTVDISSGDVIVGYQVDSAPENSTYGASGIYVEFFEADGTGAGQHFLGNDHYLLTDYTNGTPGTRQLNLGNAAALGIVAGDSLTATATDAEGNSSEFAPAVNIPTGPPVTISGRVLAPDGRGIRDATVIMFDSHNVQHRVRTNSFGSYRFDAVQSGQPYLLTASAKRYIFENQNIQPTGNLTNIDFTGIE